MEIDPKVAQNALLGKATQNAQQGASKTSDGPSFGDFLTDSLEGAVEAQKSAESATSAAVAGDADLVDVLQALTEAETTLNTVLSIRERLVSAYQEVMRTPI